MKFNPNNSSINVNWTSKKTLIYFGAILDWISDFFLEISSNLIASNPSDKRITNPELS